jgi:predicted DNA binding CopG/RHH family protein
MVSKDKSYRFRLSNELLEAALQKAKCEDLSLAQVLRHFLRTWVAGDLELRLHIEFEGEDQKNE